jgi:hypothetical protein
MTDTERFLAWAAEVSSYLAEKLPQLAFLQGYYLYPSERDYRLERCSCILTFEARPSAFIRVVVLPGLREIHARYADDVGDPIGYNPGWHSYELTWKKIPQFVARHAKRFCPTHRSGQLLSVDWPRASHIARWPMGSLPFQYPWSWESLDNCSNLTAAEWRPR